MGCLGVDVEVQWGSPSQQPASAPSVDVSQERETESGVTPSGSDAGAQATSELAARDEGSRPLGVDAAAGGECSGSSCPMCQNGGVLEGGRCQCPARYGGAECQYVRYLEVVTGAVHTCALAGDGAIDCWGNDDAGQVRARPITSGFRSLRAGGRVSCALRSDSTAYCWGAGVPGPMSPPIRGFDSLVLGWDAACGEGPAGSFECWGSDANGKLSLRPAEPVAQLAMGWQQSCALRLDGSLQCWGLNEQSAEAPPAGNDFVQLSLASWHGCALERSGTVRCWGTISQQLGESFVALDSRGRDTCAVRADVGVTCFGSGPVIDYPALPAVARVAVGDVHACALLLDGTLSCWGDAAALPPRCPLPNQAPAGETCSVWFE